MSDINTDVTAGSPNFAWTTNLPDFDSISVFFEIEIISYEDFGVIFWLENTGSLNIVLSYNAAGQINIEKQNLGAFQSQTILSGSYSDKLMIAAVSDGTTWQSYYKQENNPPQVGPAVTALPSLAPPNIMSLSNGPAFSSVINGNHNYGFAIIYDIPMPENEVFNQMYSRKPIRWANLNRYLVMLNAASPGVDLSGIGGNATVNGTPTGTLSDPNVPF